MLYDIILRHTWKRTGKKVYLFSKCSREEVQKIAAEINDFSIDFMVVESK